MAPFDSHTLYVHQAVGMQVTEPGSVKGEGKAYQFGGLEIRLFLQGTLQNHREMLEIFSSHILITAQLGHH